MIKNVTTGDVYKNATEAAKSLRVTVKMVLMHLDANEKRTKFASVRGCKLKEVRDKVRKRQRNTRPDLRIEIRCNMTGARYTSIKQAAKIAGVLYSMMYRHLYKRKPRYVNGMTYTFAPPKRDYVRRVVTNDLFGRID